LGHKVKLEWKKGMLTYIDSFFVYRKYWNFR